MGREAECELRWKRQAGVGRARLEEKALQWRGPFRLDIPFSEIRGCEAKAGELRIDWSQGPVRLQLGPAAEKWALAIRYPRSVVDKLGVKAGMRVAWLGVVAPELERQLVARAGGPLRSRAVKGTELVLMAASRPADLSRLAALRRAIDPAGAIWVVWPKGRRELREDDVREAAKRHGLVDVKVASVSESLSGLKLVIPLASR